MSLFFGCNTKNCDDEKCEENVKIEIKQCQVSDESTDHESVNGDKLQKWADAQI